MINKQLLDDLTLVFELQVYSVDFGKRHQVLFIQPGTVDWRNKIFILRFLDISLFETLLLYIRLTMKNVIGREHSINSQ